MGERDVNLEQRIEITPEQIRAILIEREAGKLLAKEHPEIADDYRKGMTGQELAEKYELIEKYKIPSREMAKRTIGFALENLIPKEELKEIELMRHKRWGELLYEQKLGIYGMTAEERDEANKKGANILRKQGKGVHAMTHDAHVEAGRKGGTTTYERRNGLFTMTHEERIELGKRAGRSSVLARGYTPWIDDEKKTLVELAQDPEYQHHNGKHIGRPYYNKIQQRMKEIFGIERTIRTLRTIYGMIKKAEEGKK
jgi:general stress protein YciG